MFDLDRAIWKFLVVLKNRGNIHREHLLEIESHLRDEIDDLYMVNGSVEVSFAKACERLGKVNEIDAEFNAALDNTRWTRWAIALSYYFNMEFIMRLVMGLLVAAGFMIGGLLLEGGKLSSFTQLTAGLITAGGALGALLVAYPWKSIKETFFLTATGRDATSETLLRTAAICRSFGNFSLLAGGVSVLMGTVHVLEHLDEPQFIGPGVAVAVIGLFYSLLLKLFVGSALHDSFVNRAAMQKEHSLSPAEHQISLQNS